MIVERISTVIVLLAFAERAAISEGNVQRDWGGSPTSKIGSVRTETLLAQ
jgi:hypothetical protein